MATPELETFEIELSSDGFTLSPNLNTFEIEVAPTSGFPPITPLLRTFEAGILVSPFPPVVTLDNPTTGTQSGIISLEATASDPNIGGSITQVEFLVDGLVVNTDATAPYQFNYDTSVLSDASHNFQARATNAAGLTTTTPILNLPVDNSPPTVSFDSPTAGIQTGTILLEATASDTHSGITLVEFLVDGTPVGSDATAPYQFNLDTSTLTDGSRNFAARATNGAGQTTTTGATALVVDNSPPVVSFDSPTSGTLTGPVTLSASASDSVSGITLVEFLVDGTPVGSQAVPPYDLLFDTSILSDGPHTFTARATNGAGITQLSSGVLLNTLNVGTLPSVLAPECVDINDRDSDQAVRVEYVYRVLTNFLKLLNDEDAELLSRYWGGMQQVTEDYYLQAYQANLSKNIFSVPVFRRSRWNEIVLSRGSEPALLQSTVVDSSFDTSTGTGDNTLTLLLDGNPFTTTFTDTSSNPIENVVDEINLAAMSAFPGVSAQLATAVEGRLQVRSIGIGQSSSVAVDALDDNEQLGFFANASASGSGEDVRAQPAQLIGTVASAIFDTSIANSANTLSIQINSGATQVITLPDDPTTTIIAVINAINQQIPGLASQTVDNRIVLTSPVTGSTQRIDIPSGGGNSELGFADGAFSIGCGPELTNFLSDRPVSYQLRIGTSDDNLNLVPIADPAIISIPALRSRIDGPLFVMGQGDSPHLGTAEIETDFGTTIDPEAELLSNAYVIRDGRIHFTSEVESQIINYCLDILWAEDVYRNDTYLEDNFGFPIQVVRENSLEYKNVLQGLHHAYWTGPNIRNTEVGLNLLFGLPVAPVDGRIDEINIVSEAQLVGTEASDVFDVRDSNRTFAFEIDGTFVFAIFDPLSTVPATGPAPSLENYPAAAVVADINAAALTAGLGYAPASLISPALGIFQVVLTGQQSVRIDSITGNAAIGFPPGETAFGENEIIIDGQSFTVSSEFPITKNPGDIVQRLDPLTDGVDILHYITDPIWWEVFGLASLDSQFSISNGYTQADLEIINEILKYHVFGVKIVPDAFTRLGNIERGIVSKFINDIKPLTKNFILLIPFVLLDVFSLTDDAALDGFPDTAKNIQLTFPKTLDVSNWNQIGTNENVGIAPDTTSFTAANSGVTRENLVDGTFAGDLAGFSLDPEEVYVSNGGTIEVLDDNYSSAIIESDNAGPYDTQAVNVGTFTVTFNGSAVVFDYGVGATDIPESSSITANEIAAAMNSKIAASAIANGFATVGATSDGKLVIRADRYDGVAPTVDLGVAVPELEINIAPGTEVGSSATSIETVIF